MEIMKDGKIIYVGYIYRHWIVNDSGVEKSYIGKTIHRPSFRWGNNGKGYEPRAGEKPTKFYQAIKKYGWDSFQHDVLLKIECNTEEELTMWLADWETYYFEKYDSVDNGYNIQRTSIIMDAETRFRMGNGSRSKPMSNEHKANISKALAGKPKSDEAKQNMSNARKGKYTGENNPFYGRLHTEESRKKISESRKGKLTGDEHPARKNGLSEEHRHKLSEAKKGSKISNEHKQKLIQANSRKVICLNTREVFESVKSASNKYHGHVGKCCRGETKTAGTHPDTGEKLHWMYYDEYLKLEEKDDNENGKY